ncbi:hypothetical protein AB0B78_25690 [Streptomyces sp. NPDC040724]|uniref:hypothetical protein n=1 Tax=Streptomyces sp. NPDC040724 TaxID=3155612 RepID=UPI0033F354FF
MIEIWVAIVAFLGSIGGGLVGARTGLAQAKATVAAAKTTAEAAIKQAKEAAGGPSFEASTARNAEFQKQRRDRYTTLVEALTDSALASQIPARIRAAQIVVKSPDLRRMLDNLAADPTHYQNNTQHLNDLTREMNRDAALN